jgi:hypothetical protein
MHISAVLSKPLASRPPLLRCPPALPAPAWQRRQLGVAAVKGGGGQGSAAGSGRRVKLVKRREKLPGGQRNRPKYQDEPRKLEVRVIRGHTCSGSPSAAGCCSTCLWSSGYQSPCMLVFCQPDERITKRTAEAHICCASSKQQRMIPFAMRRCALTAQSSVGGC